MLQDFSTLFLGRRLSTSSFNAIRSETSDYIVAGAGNAGITLAIILAEAGYEVALVEASTLRKLGNGNFSHVPLYASVFQYT